MYNITGTFVAELQLPSEARTKRIRMKANQEVHKNRTGIVAKYYGRLGRLVIVYQLGNERIYSLVYF